jgi:hypothetical protein
MTNQLHANHKNVNANLNKLWLYCTIFLSVLVLITLISSASILPTAFYLVNIALCLLFAIGFLVTRFKGKPLNFVKIEENNLQYYCPVKKELVVIPVQDITNITSRFCELQIHTTNRTHCLNLNQIKQEQQRWEIKEMIKKLALENEKRACNF